MLRRGEPPYVGSSKAKQRHCVYTLVLRCDGPDQRRLAPAASRREHYNNGVFDFRGTGVRY